MTAGEKRPVSGPHRWIGGHTSPPSVRHLPTLTTAGCCPSAARHQQRQAEPATHDAGQVGRLGLAPSGSCAAGRMVRFAGSRRRLSALWRTCDRRRLRRQPSLAESPRTAVRIAQAAARHMGPSQAARLNAGNRCADRRFPRSRTTVGAKGMRSMVGRYAFSSGGPAIAASLPSPLSEPPSLDHLCATMLAWHSTSTPANVTSPVHPF